MRLAARCGMNSSARRCSCTADTATIVSDSQEAPSRGIIKDDGLLHPSRERTRSRYLRALRGSATLIRF